MVGLPADDYSVQVQLERKTPRLDILCCPQCRKKFELESGYFLCQSCGVRYPSVENVPVLMLPDAQQEFGLLESFPHQRPVVKRGWRKWKSQAAHLLRPPAPAIHYGAHEIFRSRSDVKNRHLRLDKFLDQFPPGSCLIDIGAGDRKLRPDCLNLDVSLSPATNVLADAHRLPFKSDVFDGVVLQTVLEHTKRPWEIVREVHRVMKPGAQVFIEVPFIYPVHDAHDYYRWTLQGLRFMCGEYFEEVDANACMGGGSVLSLAVWDFCRLYLSGGRNYYAVNILDRLGGWVSFPLKYLDLLIAPNERSHEMAASIFFIGAKAASTPLAAEPGGSQAVPQQN